MCGFAGYLNIEYSSNFPGKDVLRDMGDAIRHRGPDDSGYWDDQEVMIGLVHRRLSILDLSPAGHQPMLSAGSRFVIAFNGEIYNHQALRALLNKSGIDVAWRGHSDTETLLACVEAWGIEHTLRLSIGMFSISLWDRSTKTLTLARDRFGEKPLYYGLQKNTFLFGSELKALKAHPSFEGEIDRDALCLYVRYNYIPAPRSIYKGINKLAPGTYLTISFGDKSPKVFQYWSAGEAAANGINNRFSGSPEDAVLALEKHLGDAIEGQMLSDVPLGAFLSGGIDSSTVVGIMQNKSVTPVKTFTIGFGNEKFNEAHYAKAVANHLGTDHTELFVTPNDAMGVIPLLPNLYDEPFADVSQIPTYLVSKLARKHVTVALSGDGGDELFSGYNRYKLTDQLWGKLSHIPLPFRRFLARNIQNVSPDSWNNIGSQLEKYIPFFPEWTNFGDKIHKGAAVMSSSSVSDLYLGMVSHWNAPDTVVLRSKDSPFHLSDRTDNLGSSDNIEKMMLLDTLTYLPDDILCKVDRAAMGVSLETRVPLIDHRVFEFAWTLPKSYKLRDGQTKWLLRQVLLKYVPRELIDRPKMGFGVPIDEWLRGPLKDWASNLLSEDRLRQEGYFEPLPILKKWREHLSGQRNWQSQLWPILVFQAWLVENN